MKITIEKSKSGDYTAKVRYMDALIQNEREIYLCSKYNPIKEAEKWAEKVYMQEVDTYIIYGLGMGYHICALQKKLNTTQKIYVIESNETIYKYACKYNQDFEENVGDFNILLLDSFEKIQTYLVELLYDENKLYGNKEVILHQPSINIIPTNLSKLREILEICLIKTQKNSVKEQQNIQIKKNYEKNEISNYTNVEKLFNIYKNKTVIIVSAGPSLEKNINYLKYIDSDVIILATGRILKSLVERKIKVDLFCMTDATEGTLPQITGVENLNIPFIFLNTTYHETVEKYKGPKYIAYSMDYPETQKGRISSGGSVATAAIDLAIKLGANKIVLIGQDLAYTNMKTHIDSAGSEKIFNTETMKKVKDINGNYIPTSLGLISMKHWIEQKIKIHPEVEFINCTEGGAYIEGCRHQRLKDSI